MTTDTRRLETYAISTKAPRQPIRTQLLLAWNPAHAISSALELAGPGARLLRCTRTGEWE